LRLKVLELRERLVGFAFFKTLNQSTSKSLVIVRIVLSFLRCGLYISHDILTKLSSSLDVAIK
jgi:hypothetical protein